MVSSFAAFFANVSASSFPFISTCALTHRSVIFYPCMCVCMYVCTYVYVCMYVSMYVCVCMYYVCIFFNMVYCLLHYSCNTTSFTFLVVCSMYKLYNLTCYFQLYYKLYILLIIAYISVLRSYSSYIYVTIVTSLGYAPIFTFLSIVVCI